MIKIKRQTEETKIDLQLDLYGTGEYSIETGIGFFNHMLAQFSRHGFFDLRLTVDGDLNVDPHHTVEDAGIVLGQGIKKQLGSYHGIKRFADLVQPMDESLVLVAVDVGGRPYYKDDLHFDCRQVGEFPVQLLEEFFRSLAFSAGLNLHLKMLRGDNCHHLLEACFKGAGRAISAAVQPEEKLNGKALSTKGQLGEDV